jgi:hypothetical protein
MNSIQCFRALTAGAALLFSAALTGQCERQWLPGDGLPDVDGPVYASTWWDPDGAGPQPERLVIGGNFTIAGPLLASNIAALDPVTGQWTALGTGTTGTVRALATLANGELVATGEFAGAGAAAVNYIARWDGSTWNALGSGLGSFGFALAVAGNGDLYVGGFFLTAGGQPAPRLARWNGSAWSSVGGSIGLGTAVFALLIQPNGELWAGGNFATAGGVQANHLARWNGSQWSAFAGAGAVGASAPVYALHRRPNGETVVAGDFAGIAGIGAVGAAVWQGTAFTALPAIGSVRVAATLANGELQVGGSGLLGGAAATAIWNGSVWTSDNTGPLGSVSTLAIAGNGDLFAGGSFPACGTQPLRNFARRSGAVWGATAAGGLDGDVTAILPLPDGSSIVGGRFVRAGGQVCNGIARRVGNSWQPLGTGLQNPGIGVIPAVHALARMPNGDVIVGGAFAQAGGVPASNIARWNGSTWTSVGGGIGGTSFLTRVDALLVRSTGELVAGGTFTSAGAASVSNVAQWDGTSWAPLGSLGGTGLFFQPGVRALVELPTGQIAAGGFFPLVDGVSLFTANVAQWNGSSWTAQTAVAGEIRALAVLANGDLVASGGNNGSNPIVRFDGTAWSSLPIQPPSFVHDLLPLPNGELVLGSSPLLRWNGTTTTSIPAAPSGPVAALALADNGDLLVGGGFVTAASPLIRYFAVAAATCPAATTDVGTGCSGSGGLNLLVPRTRPWLGSTFAITATGMPSLGLAVGVRGLSLGSTPLANIVQPAPAGCSLYVSQDLIDLYLLSGGTARIEYPLPTSITLAGLQFHQQVVALELAPNGLVEATSTQAVTLTLGAL